jgi:hypothetical protein
VGLCPCSLGGRLAGLLDLVAKKDKRGKDKGTGKKLEGVEKG